ncbi:GntR family transcriptional regulator [Amycolatopsis sp. NPDC059657]|uniref:GntR family transcriptional regulator n=1 Tax=Amycolatopsis sp. NPDC059657 TaxID=3346899 RepID=UPI00366C69D9
MPRTHDTRPRHQQIAADLRAQITSGDLPPQAQVPSTAQLRERYDAATSTVQRALADLKDEGYLVGHAGKGVFVRDVHPIVITAAAYIGPDDGDYRYELLHVQEVTPPADVTRALHLDDGATASVRHRLLLLDDEPIELSASYYPTAIAAGTPLAKRAKIRGGAPRVLAELGHPQRRYTDRISTRAPTTAEVEALRLPISTPIIRTLRVIFTDTDTPVEASVLIKGGHLYEIEHSQDI